MSRQLSPLATTSHRIAALSAGLAALVSLCSSAASGQDLASQLAPEGLVLVDVRAPDDPEHAVRLSYAPSAQAAPVLWIEVHAARDAAGAVRRARFWAGTASAGLDARPDLGEHAWGDARMVVLAVERWAVHVRVLAGAHDATAIARTAAARLRAARRIASPAPRLLVPGALQGDVPVPVRFEGDVLAAWVTADGSAYARRSPNGEWLLARSGDGSYLVRAIAVTSDLTVVALTSPAGRASSSAAAE